jgi:hypothetical protein
MEAWRGQHLAHPNWAVSGDARVGHPVAGARITLQCRLAFLDGGLCR